MEANNLQYIRWHQAELFAESYQGLVDHINQQLQLDAPVAGVGRRMILPSSFTGGPRFMKHWPEISQNLPRWATASDRPDLVSRVFNAKLKQLMRDITVNNIFGNVDAYVYTVEFQKRGLPHAHILIILSEGSKLLTADDVDNVVYAFLPDPVTEPRLFDCVTRHMIHGPCGTLNPNSPCMVDNSCSKKFPKEYSEETVYIADGGYPKYCRQNNGPVARVRNQEVRNEFVVPYNPYLLAKYDAHINVEVCSTVKSVHYINSRYVSPPEAVWRLFAYKLHDISHTVVRLPVHLENYHNVYFSRGQELQGVQNNALPRTKLTAFFALNERNVDARQYLYHEIPTHYTWQVSSKEWRLRQRQAPCETLYRMYVVNSLDRDRFHLRLLLLHRRGPRTFRDLKTVNGVVHATYAAAAVALGLLKDDEAWRACMTESSALDTATQLRYLYVTILLFCQPTDPVDLYRRFEVNMMKDFNRRFQNVDRARAACLKVIRDLLRARGKSLDDYGLLSPDEDLLEPDQDDPMFGAIDAAVAWQQRLRELNDEQRTVYDRVMAAIDDNRNVQKMFYVDGPGGTGKTTLYGCLISSLRNRQQTVLSVAYTGIAASLMEGGMTVHLTFGLPLGTLTEQSTSSITMQSLRAQRIREASLIVWDEAPMSTSLQFTMVDRLLKDIMGSALPFGGKPILLAGDFRQILPVVRRGNRSSIVMSSIKRHSLWREFEQFRLTRNMRADNDADFAAWLLRLGNGQLPSVDGIPDTVDIPTGLRRCGFDRFCLSAANVVGQRRRVRSENHTVSPQRGMPSNKFNSATSRHGRPKNVLIHRHSCDRRRRRSGKLPDRVPQLSASERATAAQVDA
ncbi:uncharacterized protein LOC103308586 [Acyrthosiphon pisum]|uniref:ATP-dependent DNA helicase n=1 Tax=Acyrthosiphon pisum TaxID=7029 RepID=A0A8R2B3Z5_ACYPI|nr:uncharacterized protein LOC103308586 [Acyrthosiphon pisum]|eukprot:XP_008180455.1 PREDICTED: uncharacterized protein LOC103308586 [Acyrthosiphon pisum]